LIIITLACIIALFFGVNIGASGAAASMGIAYGSGAVSNRKIALIICGIGVFLGAYFGGGEVVKTLGSGIIPETFISTKIALIILCSASISLFIANITGIPLSTSEVTVGAVVGVGIALGVLYVNNLLLIIACWIVIPVIAFILAFFANRVIRTINHKLPFLSKGGWPKLIAIVVAMIGFLEAFSAGMNNVANAVGPLVAAGILSIELGTFYGGIAVALGAILLGSKVMETNGKRITDLSLLQGGAVSSIGATLVIIASLFGIPVPLTQISTCSILGIGVANSGREMWRKSIIVKLVKTWVISPFFSLVISYNLVKVVVDFDHTGIVMLIVFISLVYLINLWKPSQKTIPISNKKVALKK
jgi:sulfate permease